MRGRPTGWHAGLIGTIAAGAAVLVLWCLAAVGPAAAQEPPGEPGGRVLALTVDGPITPVMAGHVDDGIARAEREGYEALLVRLDTPGGLDGSMRAIIQDILAAEVPVIVHVAPSGARAASAGALITLSAHVAAMAPGTAIGAATPVGGEGGEDLDRKVVNDAAAYARSLAELRGRDVDFAVAAVREGRSISAAEAVDIGAADVLAATRDDLLDAIDGTTVTVGPDDREVVLATAGAPVDEVELGLLRTIQRFLVDPNVAFLLLSIGTLALIYELASPGMGAGAVVGGSSILIALFGLAVIPLNVTGIALLVLAAGLFAAELFTPGTGVAAVSGAVALVLAGVFLFRDVPGLETSLAVILPSAVAMGGAVVVAGQLALRTRAGPSRLTGADALVGAEGSVRLVGGRPSAFVGGAWWSVRADEPLDPGAPVRVVAMDGLDLVVERVPAPDPDTVTEPPPASPANEARGPDGGPLSAREGEEGP
ncbi:MAG: nodulation protein NfeD [Acidimicrobiales bacterium]